MKDTARGRISLAAGWLWCVGCGPEVDAAPVLYEPRVCGQDGPVSLVSLDEAPAWTALRPVGDRWMLLSVFTPLGRGLHEGEAFRFAAHTLDPCGGREARLPENLWPIILGESLFGCDVLDGTVYQLDPRTAETGPVVGTGLQCDTLRADLRRVPGGSGSADGDFALMRVPETRTVAVLDATGALTQTAIPFTIPLDEQLDGPYVDEPFTSVVGWSTIPYRTRWSAEGGTLVLGDDGTLWRFTSSAAAPLPVAEGVHEFLLSEDVVVIRRREDAQADRFAVQLLDLTTDIVQAGPEVTHLRMESGYLHLPDAFFDPAQGTTHPHPPAVDAPHGVLPGSELGCEFAPHFRVWEVETGAVLVDADDGPVSGQPIRVWDDAVTVTHHRHAADSDEIWTYPLDGSSPELIYESAAGFWANLQGPDEVLIHPSKFPADFTHVDLTTGKSWVLMPNVVSHVVHPAVSLVESPIFEGRRPKFYWVDDDGGSSLFVTLLPDRD